MWSFPVKENSIILVVIEILSFRKKLCTLYKRIAATPPRGLYGYLKWWRVELTPPIFLVLERKSKNFSTRNFFRGWEGDTSLQSSYKPFQDQWEALL